jgi:thiol:disulfide interchange protein DsbC
MIRSFSQTTIATLIAVGSLFLVTAAFAAEQDEKLENVRSIVSGMFDQIEGENVNPSPIDGWYTIQKGPVIAYISDDGRYLMQGELIDLDAEVNLTEKIRNTARHDTVTGISNDQFIKFSPADVKNSITVFTDVECTYCRRLHSQIDEYLSYGIEVRYLLYPRNGPASSSWNTSEEVWCSSDRQKALTAAKLDREFQTSACDASVIQDNYALGAAVGLSGTPAIILEDGTLISGYVPPDALNERLEKQNKGSE